MKNCKWTVQPENMVQTPAFCVFALKSAADYSPNKFHWLPHLSNRDNNTYLVKLGIK